MEGVDVSEMGWNSSSFMSTTLMPTVEESELMAQLLVGCERDDEMSFSIPSLFCSDFGSTTDHDLYSNYSQHANSTSFCYWPQDSFNVSSAASLFALPMDESVSAGVAINCNTDEQHMVFTGCFGSQEETSSHEDLGESAMNSAEPVGSWEQKRVVHKRKFSMDEVNMNIDYECDKKLHANVDDSKKKGHKGTKKPKLRKTQKSIRGIEEEDQNNGGAVNMQCTSCCSSEDESNASLEQNGGGSASSGSKGPAALNLNGKTRATRGSATDPQSLYARKRRERINERLRILQNLVPNGTKVDISTMLEEAVQYVKFLQLQIKLLSSDELWMYAPLAYNGMGIGL